MSITVGKYTLQIIFNFCLIPCLLLLVAGWSALGLPQVFSIIGSSLILVGIVKLIERRYPKLNELLHKDFPENVKLGGLTLHIIRMEPLWTLRRKIYLAVGFGAWIVLMISSIVFGAAWFGDSFILISVMLSVALFVLFVNCVEKMWRA